ncbi:MAG: DUF1289 domain-containing protein [Rhizobiaceae bacterium]|nr:DUF1289 domain-containing protein [Rhizobiaceae bacterium]
MTSISSPCILVCSIDDKSGYCFGCGRTSAEIGVWANLSEPARLHIMAELETRLETIERKPKRETRRKKLVRLRASANAGQRLS